MSTDPDELAARVRDGELRLHEVDTETDPDTAATARRIAMADATDASLDTIGDYAFDAGDAENNIENMVGAVQIPLGVAGPLPVDGSASAGTHHLPLATTEGALVASVNRGCSVLRQSGGATAAVTAEGMTRAPVFAVSDVSAGASVIQWVRDHEAELADAAESTTSHGQLRDIEPSLVGRRLFLRFRYTTGDAMGMNMVTIATEAACDLIESETNAELLALSGNLCADKKPAAVNAVTGRGRSVTAEAEIPASVIEDVLGTTPAAMAEIQRSKNFLGSAKAASLGFNAHVANVVAAMFLATGQDEAHVVEGANAITTITETAEGIHASVTCASLQVGTVGGGTTLPPQREALELLGLAGGGDPPGSNADALAEIIAAGALAGELSLIGALAGRQLSQAHEALGR